MRILRVQRRLLWLIGLVLLSLLPVGSAAAQTNARCFPETGYCISGAIRTYWERNGGLPVFGYPIGPLQTETNNDGWTGPTQLFERDRLEDHSGEGLGILAGRLGALRLEQLGRPWQYGPNIQQPARNRCRLFPETGYNVCGDFRVYWERNGGLERFGYPLTDVIQENVEGKMFFVQYFERRRMEYHPENRPPYNILLGLLGVETRGGPAACNIAVLGELRAMAAEFGRDTALGCPVPGQDYSNTQAAAARFERGQMYWVNLRGGQGVIHVILYGPYGQLTHRQYVDTWREGDIVNGGLTPPQGLYEPNRGFGKVWRENPDIRAALGWALENERAEMVSYQVFGGGSLLQVYSEGVTWQFYGPGFARNAPTRY